MATTNGTCEITAMNWLVCGDKVILETPNAASKCGQKLEWDEALRFKFRGGRKSKIEMFQADQAAVDSFFGA